MKPQADDSLNLLLTLEQPGQERLFRAGAGSIAVHLVFGFLFLLMLRLDASRPPAQAIPEADLRKFTPLVDPPMHMTQPEPNVNKPSLEVNLQSLLSRPQPNAAPAHMRFRAPQPVQTPGPAVPTLAPPPNIETALKSPVPALGTPNVPLPPPATKAEQPKLAFETPGSASGKPLGGSLPKIELPKTSVDEAIKGIARNGGGGGVVVGDADDMGPSDPLHPTPQKSHSSSQLELLSDPKGVDFRPYLVQVLAAVRRNWFAVIPESARMGRRGRVQIQFAISHDGNVPKLVISSPSGADALDRAAVASISASNPFPPLPPQFHGNEVRLQLSFRYNTN